MANRNSELVEEAIAKILTVQWSTSRINDLIGAAVYDRDEKLFNEIFAPAIAEYVSRGGKRLRPNFFLTLLAALAVENPSQYVELAAVIEVLHNALLVVDDVQDNSKLRRGKPTMHEALGVDVAINNGIMMHWLPLAVICRSNIATALKSALTEIITQEILSSYFGQALDIAWHKNPKKIVSEREYLEMCRLKTGSLMRLSAHFACLVAKKNEDIVAKVCAFAEAAGIAFQIRDDVLDLTGTPESFGKAYGNDITEGKKSLPVILALQQLPADEAKRLQVILNQHTQDLNLIKEAQQLIALSRAVDDASDLAEKMFADAWQVVADVFTDNTGKAELYNLSRVFIDRKI